MDGYWSLLRTWIGQREKWNASILLQEGGPLPGSETGLLSAAAAKSLQSCPTLCDSMQRQPTRLPHPWDSSGKNTGVDCHFLLQCMKVKSESEVAQSCPTSSDSMDCSLPGFSAHGIFQARVLEWGAIAFSGLLSNTQKRIVRGDTCADKARDFIVKGHPGGEQ